MKPPIVRAAGGIVCRYSPNDLLEVLLVGGTHREPDHWSFPKGRQHRGEAIEMTALREVREETGLHIELIALVGINAYKFVRSEDGHLQDKTVRLYLARCIGGDMRDRDHERLDVRWISADEACNRLKYPRDRELLIDTQMLLDKVPAFRHLLKE
jgi:8-oxo-dGTP pyrophosphatase MutT (NUDIX family)